MKNASLYFRLILMLAIGLISARATVKAGGTGPTAVTLGETATYTYNNGFFILGANWVVSSHGTIQSTSISGTTYTCVVKWDNATGTGNIAFKGITGGTNWSTNVSISPPPLAAGSISGAQTLCYNGNPATITSTANASGGTGSYSYQWQWRYSITGSSWSTISGATGATYTPPAQTATKDFRRRVTSGSATAYSNTVRVTIYGNLAPGTISGSATLCYNGNPAAFAGTVKFIGEKGWLIIETVLEFDGQSSKDRLFAETVIYE